MRKKAKIVIEPKGRPAPRREPTIDQLVMWELAKPFAQQIYRRNLEQSVWLKTK